MGEALSLLQGWPLVPKHSSFLSLDSRKRRVSSLTPRKALPAVGDGIPDPIILDSPPDELLGRLGLPQPLDPKPLLLEALWSR